jgi:hypothetical protein
MPFIDALLHGRNDAERDLNVSAVSELERQPPESDRRILGFSLVLHLGLLSGVLEA